MFKYLLKFIKFAGKQRKHMIIALVFGLLQSVFTAFSLLATAYALQNMIEGTANMSTVWSAFGIVGGGVLLAAVCNYFSTQFLTYAGYTIAANARIRIADKLKYAPMGYFNEHNLGQIANTATNTAESLQDTLTRCLLLTTKGLFMALVITISLLVFDWRIGLSPLVDLFFSSSSIISCIRREKRTRTERLFRRQGGGGRARICAGHRGHQVV